MVARKTTWLAVGLLGLMAGFARADHVRDFGPVTSLANNIEHYAHDLEDEFKIAYRGNPFYGQLLAYTRQIDARSAQLAKLSREGADYRVMHHTIDDLRRSYAALAKTVRAADGVRYTGHSGSWRPVTGSHREHVREHMAEMNRSIELAHERVTSIFFPPTRPHDHDHHHHHHGSPGFSYGTPANTPSAGFSFANGRLRFSFGR